MKSFKTIKSIKNIDTKNQSNIKKILLDYQKNIQKISDYVYSKDNILKEEQSYSKQFILYHGHHLITNQKIIIQVIHIINETFSQQQKEVYIKQKFQIIKKFKNIYFLKYYDVFVDASYFYFITQSWEKTLQSQLKNNLQKKLAIPDAFKYFVQIFNAYSYIKNNIKQKQIKYKVIDYALHPKRILIKNGCCKLVFLKNQQQNKNKVQKSLKNDSTQFFAPQKFTQQNQKNHIWTLGSILYYMTTGTVLSNKQNVQLNRPHKCTQFIWKILKLALKYKISQRVSFQQLKAIIFQGEKPRSLKDIQNNESYGSIKSQKQIIQNNKSSSSKLSNKFQDQNERILRNQINYIYFLKRLDILLKNCSLLSFSQQLKYICQFNIKMWINRIENFINQLIKDNLILYDSYQEQFSKIKKGYSQQSLKQKSEKNVFSNERMKLFDTKNYFFSQNLIMQIQALLRKFIISLNESLKQLNYQKQIITHQNQILLLDFTITYFQLNSLIIQQPQNKKYFADNSSLNQIVQAPVLVNLAVYNEVCKKLKILEIK